MAETTQKISTKQDSQTEKNPFVSFLQKLNLKFPSFSNSDDKKEDTKVVAVEDKRNTVKFVEKPTPPSESLKIESEDVKSTHPVVLWQVYALGGFLVLRWIWGRWNERKARRGSSGDQGSDDDQDNDAQD